MADKKKRIEETQSKPAETSATPETPDPDLTDGENGDDVTETLEIKPVALTEDEFDIVDEEENDDESTDDEPRPPSQKEVLNRLLEKNEIILKLNKDNAEKDKQLKELNDKWLRSVAEFENYRKRTRKEWELLKQQSKTEVILEILEITDDFERAFSVAEDANTDEFVNGIRLIYNNLTIVLDRFGVSEIEAHKSSFDPNFHMAVGQIETGDVPSGFVAEVVQKGYKLDDSVIRPARVIVAK